MNYQVFNIFPVAIYAGEIIGHEEYKKEFYKIYPKYDYEETDENNTVSENVGNPFIHLEENLEPLFEDIISHVKFYVYEVLGYKEIFNFVITKTWLSRARNPHDEIKWHIHSTSHISFVYYVSFPQDAHTIKFKNPHSKNSLFLGSTCIDNNESRVMVKENNQYNSDTFFLSPQEGNLLLFPSSLSHCTQKVNENFNQERLAIVGDVTLTLKEDELTYSMGYIDPKYWKVFS